MKYIITYLLLLTGLSACNYPDHLEVSAKESDADIFARHFIDNLIYGQIDSCFAEVYPASLNDETKEYITRTSKQLRYANYSSYKVVENTARYDFLSHIRNNATHKLAYEFEFARSIVLFKTLVYRKDSKYYVQWFNAGALAAPLSQQTAFTLKNKSIVHYIFLVVTILVPVFVFITFLFMLFSKLRPRQKVFWSFIILLVCIPRIFIEWNSGHLGFQLKTLNFLGGSGFSRANLYSYWQIYFCYPAGAAAYWALRKRLLGTDKIKDVEVKPLETNIPPTEVSNPEYMNRFKPPSPNPVEDSHLD